MLRQSLLRQPFVFFLRAALLSIAVSLSPLLAHAVTIDVVAVGNPGNSADTTGVGTVASSYYISKHEVTIGQYVEFLNAVAVTDANGLFVTGMDTDRNIRGITQSGSDGSYSYAAAGPDGTSFGQSAANRPITFVSWNNAARFANWMANGQPTGAQNGSTTEDGAYLIGATITRQTTNPNTGAAPTYALPTSNQWYKAAYYSPTLNSGSGGYYNYATQSDTSPGNTVGSSPNQANVVVGSNYSLTQSSTLDTTQNYLADVGTYSGSSSFYGTLDQTGNTSEWTDPGTGASNALLRGGAWNVVASGAGSGISVPITTANYDTGFRLVATVPEPGTIGLLVSGAGCGLWQLVRRRRGGRPAA
jgi:formylglycine-generating enzyme required for sulfatase activity